MSTRHGARPARFAALPVGALGVLGALVVATVLSGCSTSSSDPTPASTLPRAQVPPLHAEVDGWPESEVSVDGAPVLVVKVATSPAQRARGLMEVPEVPAGTGMLFLFDSPRTGGFWMKNTVVGLDIAYLLDGRVVSVREMEPCLTEQCPTYPADSEFDAALEVGSGVLAELGVTVGDRLEWTEPKEVAA